ncbi:MAG: Zn-ribbon domain-containing OB-fold protein [Deltaproteobacteria bacterium]|nr:Zn-ribbon domain-containing OB-fold protein [Deltaproteobacteria bacterium]MBW2121293.1 Zn-ribbon domain-containing OB-fold protein [Deltaproteobacteria bacterium]HDZ91679.1 Zn-ribbon domain-containing OB-fold protein [Deltaproteobacteria bacterium]
MAYPITYDEYQKNLEKGRFVGLKCKKCQTVSFPPTAVCRACGATALEPVTLGGGGTVKTFTVIRVAPEGRKPPYIVVMVELDEGPFVLGNLDGIQPDQATMDLIGKRVHMDRHLVKGDVYSGEDTYVPLFRPESS